MCPFTQTHSTSKVSVSFLWPIPPLKSLPLLKDRRHLYKKRAIFHPTPWNKTTAWLCNVFRGSLGHYKLPQFKIHCWNFKLEMRTFLCNCFFFVDWIICYVLLFVGVYVNAGEHVRDSFCLLLSLGLHEKKNRALKCGMNFIAVQRNML